MKKIRKRIFAAALAAVLLATMPGTASVAAEETVLTDSSPETGTEQTGNGADAVETETTVPQKPAEEDDGEKIPGTGTDSGEKIPETETGSGEKIPGTGIGSGEDTPQTETGDNTEMSGEKPEEVTPPGDTAFMGRGDEEGDTEAVKPEDVETEDTGLCAHHKEHTEDCGYVPVSEDREGSPCAYECRICPIEELIAALPDKVTESNAEKVRAQLNKILTLYGKLNEEEQGRIDLSRCLELQKALDAANVPVTAEGHTEQQADDEASVTMDGGETLYYATLEEAFAAANGNTAVITMLTDAERIFTDSNNPAPLAISRGTVTLDMNGKTLSGGGYGYYGIIHVSGGSLTVQGNSTIAVQPARIGLSCYGGTLTVAGIQFQLITSSYASRAAILNRGGTIIINSSTITGMADIGQVYHWQGNTIINDATATGTTGNYPKGVYYYENGSLKINGGSFSNITVDKDSELGAGGISALLGSGMTYRHTEAAGGAWAAEDELTELTIENVTVQKIPLTINPQAETSWYYNSGGHSLTMNAAPAAAGNAVTYEWYVQEGENKNKLDCTADAYPVPEDLVVGSYIYTCEATCDGYTLSHEFTFDVIECPHTGLQYTPLAGGKHGGTCPVCKAEVAEEHEWKDAVCSVCGTQAVAKVEKAGKESVYVTSLADAFISEHNGATVILLENVTEKDIIIKQHENLVFVLDLAGYTINGDITVQIDDELTIQDSSLGKTGSIVSYANDPTLFVSCGNLILEGGSIVSGKASGIEVENGSLSVIGDDVKISAQKSALKISGGWDETSISLSAGAYTGNPAMQITGDVDITWEKMLLNNGASGGPHYAYFDKANAPILLSDLQGKEELAGPVTVRECTHKGEGVSSCEYKEGTGTHKITCHACGYTEDSAECTYDDGQYGSDENGHTRTCIVCKGISRPEAHTSQYTFEDGVYKKICTICGYEEAKGTYTVTSDLTLSYGKTGGTRLEVVTKPEIDFSAAEWAVSWNGGQDSGQPSDHAGYILPDLEAGTYQYNVSIRYNSDRVFRGEITVKVEPVLLDEGMVTFPAENTDYDGTVQKPVFTVRQGEIPLTEGRDYKVSYLRNHTETTDFTNAGDITVTMEGIGNYTGTVTKTYKIHKADVPANDLACILPADGVYTGKPKAATVTADGLTGVGKISVQYKKDNAGEFLAEATEPGSYHVYAVVSEGDNYKSAEIEKGSFTISYMDTPTVLYNGSAILNAFYNADITVSAGPERTYTVSDAIDGEYKDAYRVSAKEGAVTKTLYFKDKDGHISAGVEVSVNFDQTPPTGEIAVGAKWWQKVLNFISFRHYAAKEYTVTIKAGDTGGSGIDTIAYAIVAGDKQYTDAGELEAAVSDWKEYKDGGRPTVPVNTGRYAVYARLTDKAGNKTYISTDGILLDSTPPAVSAIAVPEETRKDVTAGFTFTIDEAADYYYVVLPKGSSAPSAEDIIVTCGGTLPDGRTGNAIAGQIDCGAGAASEGAAVSAQAQNLLPNKNYTVYVAAVDRVWDIETDGEGKLTGNIGKDVAAADFITKKTLPVVMQPPAITGTYGQSVGEMTLTGGTVKAGAAVLTGRWIVSSGDSGKIPSAGTAEAVTVTFKPDSDSYADSDPVRVIPTVNPRSLTAEGITVSEVAGDYVYTGSAVTLSVALNTGVPAKGIAVSDSKAVLAQKDITVSYSNNLNAGEAAVTITGTGNYTGSVKRKFTIKKAPGREILDVAGSHTNDGKTYTYTITPTEGASYRMGEGAWSKPDTAEGNIFQNITPGTQVIFSAKMPGNDNYEEGTPKSITVEFPKLTPAAPALSYTVDRMDMNNVTITITPVEGAEYKFGDGAWGTIKEKSGFTTQDTVKLSIRLMETATHHKSPEQTVTVDLAKKDRETPSAFTLQYEANGEKDYTVTIPPTEGCEYSFDGEHWSEGNRKTGVKVGEIVTGYKRYKEDKDYNAGSAVSDTRQMPKFTVKTPVISPAGGSYAGSVSVTITCDSEGAAIYYTTDGRAPAGSSTRYTGAFTVTVPATVKAIAMKEGLANSAVAEVSYKKQSSGGSGSSGEGSSDGNDDSSGGDNSGESNPGGTGSGSDNSGQGTGSGSNNSGTAPAAPKTSPEAGTGTTPPAGQGTGIRPGAGTKPENNTGRQNTALKGREPFIKGADERAGWDAVRAEEEKAQDGNVINVDMNGSVVVPGDIFDSIKGRDITITFDMGDGVLWSVNGKSITRDASRDKAGDIDFSVKTGGSAIPVDIVNSVTGENYSIQISLAYSGEFGFTAVLSINIGEENAGYTASLYYYNQDTGELEFICADEIAQDGTVSLPFTHASDYVIMVSGASTETALESGTETAGDAKPAQDRETGEGGAIPSDPKEAEAAESGVSRRAVWITLTGAAAVLLAAIGALAWKRRRKTE